MIRTLPFYSILCRLLLILHNYTHSLLGHSVATRWPGFVSPPLPPPPIEREVGNDALRHGIVIRCVSMQYCRQKCMTHCVMARFALMQGGCRPQFVNDSGHLGAGMVDADARGAPNLSLHLTPRDMARFMPLTLKQGF